MSIASVDASAVNTEPALPRPTAISFEPIAETCHRASPELPPELVCGIWTHGLIDEVMAELGSQGEF